MPDYRREARVRGRVAGVDEAGRGPLAGPVLAAAVVFRGGVPAGLAELIDDSKLLSREAREAAFRRLAISPGVEIGVGAASVPEIAAFNILQATLVAMRRAVSRLPGPPDLVLIDGNVMPALPCRAECVVGGDRQCLSIAAASIVAKVLRDYAMARLSVRFPGYGWAENAGYATPEHHAAIRRLGATVHHRMRFGILREEATGARD